MHRVLIPFDGSQPALRAVQHVANLASHCKEPLDAVLVSVVPQPQFGQRMLADHPGLARDMQQPALDAARAALAPAAAALAQAGITLQQHVVSGEPDDQIDQFARRYHCDMIVMGTRGLGAASGLLLGSVTNKTVHLSRIPVLLVK